MKKAFAMILAASMALSLASVAVADTTVGNATASASAGSNWYAYDSGVKYGGSYSPVEIMEYGKSYYTPLVTNYKQEDVDVLADNEDYGTATLGEDSDGSLIYQAVVDADVVKGMKPKENWDMNGSLVSDLEIVKAKIKGSSPAIYQYWLKVTIVPGSASSVKDVIGTVNLKKTGKYKTDVDVPVNMMVGYLDAFDHSGGAAVIYDTPYVYKFDEDDAAKYAEEEDFEFEFEDFEDSYFTVNTIGQGNVVLQADADFNEDIAAKYPDANLDFFNGNGSSFNKTGVLTLYADEGSCLYVVSADGILRESNAEYDDYEEAFLIKTRTLGTYVISDMDLGVESASSVVVDDGDGVVVIVDDVEDSSSDVEVVAPINPVGGAIA